MVNCNKCFQVRSFSGSIYHADVSQFRLKRTLQMKKMMPSFQLYPPTIPSVRAEQRSCWSLDARPCCPLPEDNGRRRRSSFSHPAVLPFPGRPRAWYYVQRQETTGAWVCRPDLQEKSAWGTGCREGQPFGWVFLRCREPSVFLQGSWALQVWRVGFTSTRRYGTLPWDVHRR